VGRPAGTRNQGFEDKREALSFALVPRVMATPPASFRELADAAGVSVPTLRHYFADRDGAIRAALQAMHTLGAVGMERSATEAIGPLPDSLRWFVAGFREAWANFGAARMVAAGLAEGLGSEAVGPTFVDTMLEPSLQAAERRLAVHRERGEIEAANLRHAAIDLVSPVLLALLHQGPLGGDRCRPLDLDGFLEDHLARFVRAWGAGEVRTG
jgi:AcrR family transcriptional regulator